MFLRDDVWNVCKHTKKSIVKQKLSCTSSVSAAARFQPATAAQTVSQKKLTRIKIKRRNVYIPNENPTFAHKT
jgi:hypothetical protein